MKTSNRLTLTTFVTLACTLCLTTLQLVPQPARSETTNTTNDEQLKPIALVLHSSAQEFDEIMTGMKDDLEGDISFHAFEISRKTPLKMLEKKIEHLKPHIFIIIGNRPTNLYTSLQKQHPDMLFPPAIILATLYVDKLIQGRINNAIGISHEIPAVTSMTTLRPLLHGDIQRVGVLHGDWMKDTINENKRLLEREGIHLISFSIPNDTLRLEKKIKQGIKFLQKQNIDVLWVVNDNTLLKKSAFHKAWRPAISKINIPVAVGTQTLLEPKLQFGTYATVPNYYALGVQTASLILDMRDNNWEAYEPGYIEPIISIKTIVNIQSLEEKRIQYNKKSLLLFDKIVG